MSAVVGTVMMVAVTVSLAVVMFVFVAPLLSKPSAPKPQITLLAGNWNNGTITISFSGMSNTEHVVPSDLTYSIQSVNGTIYFAGRAGTANAVGNVTVTVEYLDQGSAGKVSGDDLIRISVNPDAVSYVRGCVFKVLLGEDVVANAAALP